MQMRQVIMIRFSIASGPIDYQPEVFRSGNTVRCSSGNGSGVKSALSLGGHANAPGNNDTVQHRQRANRLPARVLPTLALPDPRIPLNKPSSTPDACAAFAHQPLSRNRNATRASFAPQTTGPMTALWIAAAAPASACAYVPTTRAVPNPSIAARPPAKRTPGPTPAGHPERAR